jgi:serine/threonine-protein kinase
MSYQNDDEAKQKLWKMYKIFMGIMIGGGIFIVTSQWVWGAIQNFMRQQKDANPPQVSLSPTNTQQPSNPTVTPSQETTPTLANSNIPVDQEFTEEHAKVLVKRYLDAKSNIFAPPFNRQLVMELTTGKLRTEVSEAISWMQINNAYYIYEFRSVGSTGKIYYNGNSNAIAELRVIEKYVYYQNGKLDPTQADYYDKVVRWAFQKENGIWKITDREITKKL